MLAARRWSDFPKKNFILKYFQKLMHFQLLLDQDKFMFKENLFYVAKS